MVHGGCTMVDAVWCLVEQLKVGATSATVVDATGVAASDSCMTLKTHTQKWFYREGLGGGGEDGEERSFLREKGRTWRGIEEGT